MNRVRVWGAAVGCAAAVMVLAGCSSGGGDGGGKPSASAVVVSPREAFEAYQAATVSGCTDATDCQEFMTRKLAAAVQVREAMQAKDPSMYAEPIGFVDLAEDQADHYGRDNLAARGNMLAVSAPLQRMVAWFREHPQACVAPPAGGGVPVGGAVVCPGGPSGWRCPGRGVGVCRPGQGCAGRGDT